jgi:phosphatidylserine decarboxylase
MRTPVRTALSHLLGWAADRQIPAPLRAPLYRTYARITGADLSEIRDPLAAHASLSDFFVRRLKDGTRPIAADRAQIASPCDGTLQAADGVQRGSLVQAKGRSYALCDLLGGEADAAASEGGFAWTIYLSPRDYHRVHAPEDCRLAEVRRIPGSRYSVAPGVLARRLVLPVNERAVLLLEAQRGRLWMVMVGAMNVGRIRITGEDGGGQEAPGRSRRFARGEEIARFEMGSTVVLVAPPGSADPCEGLVPGARLRLGQPIGIWRAAEAAMRA